MSFRGRMLAAGVAAVLASGCALRIGEPPTPKAVNSIKPCLSGYPGVLDKYFKGTLEEATLDGFFECLSDAVRKFYQFFKGRNEGRYLKGELKDFLERYFLKTELIPIPFLDAAMGLKRALIGGRDDELSEDEIRVTL